DGYGSQILLYHPGIDAYTRYAHCSFIYVLAGQAVTAGDTIGLVGNTGRSTGPHLHLEYIIHTVEGYQYANPLILWGGE
ncbi:MAG: M23 family metallopeptidase, partial [Phycisphaerales bacterium]